MSDEDGGVWVGFDHPYGVSVGIEITETTAHAYFRAMGPINGDVWLFNLRKAPRTTKWDLSDGKAPINLDDYTRADSSVELAKAEDFSLEWMSAADGRGPPTVLIFFRGELHAVLGSGLRPGFCRLAERAGPIARPLEECQREHFGSKGLS